MGPQEIGGGTWQDGEDCHQQASSSWYRPPEGGMAQSGFGPGVRRGWIRECSATLERLTSRVITKILHDFVVAFGLFVPLAMISHHPWLLWSKYGFGTRGEIYLKF